jgi:hypothetical protein
MSMGAINIALYYYTVSKSSLQSLQTFFLNIPHNLYAYVLYIFYHKYKFYQQSYLSHYVDLSD